MNPTKTTAKDFFLNLGAIVCLYTTVISLLNLVFVIINNIYPKVTSSYYYSGSQSISWPVAVLIIFFPVFVLLMWLLEKGYVSEPEKRNITVKRWLTYITLFIAGLVLAGDLVAVLYYFIDGQELTAGFLMKFAAVLLVTFGVFMYYISDIRGKLNTKTQKMWAIAAGVVILGSVVWGFSVLGSPRTQRLYKYDDEKVNSLLNLDSSVQNYYSQKGALPKDLAELSTVSYYMDINDTQTGQPLEYEKVTNTTYKVCATFNNASQDAKNPNIYMRPVGYPNWSHPAGHYCFDRTITTQGNKIPTVINL